MINQKREGWGVTTSTLIMGIVSLANMVGAAEIGPTRLRITTESNDFIPAIDAGTCARFNVRSADSTSFVNAKTNIIVNLGDGNAGGRFYNNSSCKQQESNRTTIAANSSSASFYYKKSSRGNITLTASASALQSSSQSLVVRGPTRLSIAIVGAQDANAIGTLACVGFNVRFIDDNGSARIAPTDLSVALDDAGADGQFYVDNNCTISAAQLTVRETEHDLPFYYKKPTGGQVILTASAAPLQSTSRQITIRGAAKTAILGLDSLPNGSCGEFNAQTTDGADQPVPVAENTDLSLSDNDGEGGFYGDASCSNHITQVTVSANTRSHNFFYRNDGARIVSLSATGQGLIPVIRRVRITITYATKLSFFAPGPDENLDSIEAGHCGKYLVVATNDAGNERMTLPNTVLSLSDGSQGGTFYSQTSNNSCGGAITQVTLAGTSRADFGYQKPSGGQVTLQVQNSGLQGTTKQITVRPGVTAISIRPDQHTFNILTCQQISVLSIGENGQGKEAATDIIVNLSDRNDVNNDGNFYSDSNCATPLPNSRVIIPTGAFWYHIWYKKSTPGSVALVARATGFPEASDTVNIRTAAP